MTNSHWIELKSSINEQLIWMPHPSKGMVGGFQEFASITKSAGLEFLRWQVQSTTKAIQDRVLFPQRSLGIAKEMQSCFVSSGTSFIISFQLKVIVPPIRPRETRTKRNITRFWNFPAYLTQRDALLEVKVPEIIPGLKFWLFEYMEFSVWDNLVFSVNLAWAE